MIRLLDHRTDHHWTYQPEDADLWILGDGAKVPFTAKAAKPSHKSIYALAGQSPTDNVLPLPLNALNLENTLNRLGLQLAGVARPPISARITTPTVLAEKTVAAQPAQTVAASSNAVAMFRLKRWPSANLLGNGERIRLATLLLGIPLALVDIAKRANSSEATCMEFINALQQDGFIELSYAQMPMAASAGLSQPRAGAQSTGTESARPLSIFARIRNRLTQPIIGSNRA